MRLGWAVLAAAGPARHHKTIELAGAGWWLVLAAGPTSGPPPPGRDRPAQPASSSHQPDFHAAAQQQPSHPHQHH